MACRIFSFYAVPTLHTQKYNVPIANLTTISPLRNEGRVTDAAGFRPENTCANNWPLLRQSSLLPTSKLTLTSASDLHRCELSYHSDRQNWNTHPINLFYIQLFGECTLRVTKKKMLQCVRHVLLLLLTAVGAFHRNWVHAQWCATVSYVYEDEKQIQTNF